MTAAALQQAIKARKLPPVIYLYGGEAFLRQQALQQIEKAVLTPGSEDFNRHVFHGKGIPLEQVNEAVLTLPAFAEKRLVVVKDAQSLVAADLDSLRAYIENPVEQTCLVFSGEKIDSRRKFFQILKKKMPWSSSNLSLRDSSLPSFAIISMVLITV